jgi:IclR family KDG regulon transcriptional repressor
LKELKRVRARGYAFDRGETNLQATCVGIPIFDEQNNPIAALSISGPTSRFNPQQHPAAIESLMNATSQIAKQLQKHAWHQ